jgi:hypothetical protein
MRLAAQLRGGFYPAPPEAVAHAVSFLCPPIGQPFALLDPCAGEGAALRQLAQALECPPAKTFAIELDESRATSLHKALPDSHVLAPASCFGCSTSRNSFSFLWLNPPFDDGYAGDRVEEEFLRTATDWLLPGGVLALVCPEEVADEFSEARDHFTTYYENCQIVPFPESCRRFQEVIVLGHKRARPQGNPWDNIPWEFVRAPEGFRYRIPAGAGPRVFEKVQPTEPELRDLLAQSPLRVHLRVPPPARLPAPPLALGVGHVALLLASGHLDGIVRPGDQPPQLVRGASRKRSYVADVKETVQPDGTTSTTTTLSERIELMVRTVDLTGRIRTFREAIAPEA